MSVIANSNSRLQDHKLSRTITPLPVARRRCEYESGASAPTPDASGTDARHWIVRVKSSEVYVSMEGFTPTTSRADSRLHRAAAGLANAIRSNTYPEDARDSGLYQFRTLCAAPRRVQSRPSLAWSRHEAPRRMMSMERHLTTWLLHPGAAQKTADRRRSPDWTIAQGEPKPS